MARILVVGDVIDDVLVTPLGPVRRDTDTPARVERRAGGSAANVAAWLGVAGAAVDFVGTLHADDVSRHAQLLRGCGVTPHLIASAEPTGTIVLLLDGDARTMLTSRGANDATVPSAIPAGLLAGAGHLHLTGYSFFSTDAAAWSKLLAVVVESGTTVSVDPSSTAPLREFGVDRFLAATTGAQVVLPNLDEGRLLTGKRGPAAVADELLRHYPIVALTLGPEGVLLRCRTGEQAHVPPVPSLPRPVDPTGGGDAFAAGFLEAWRRAGDPVAAAGSGAALAARAVAAIGARPPVGGLSSR